MASVLSHVASTRTPSSPSNHHNKRRRRNRNPNASDYSVAAFRALSTEHIWSLEAPLGDAQWRPLYGLSYPVFTTVVDKLKPHIAVSNLSLPSDYAVAMVLSRLSHGLSVTHSGCSEGFCFDF